MKGENATENYITWQRPHSYKVARLTFQYIPFQYRKTAGAQAAVRRYPMSKGKGEAPARTGGASSHLESNPKPARDVQKAQTNLVCTRTQRRPRNWDRTVFGCLLRRYGSAVPGPRGRGSGCSRPGYGITLLEEGAINPTIEPPELTQDLGNRLLEGTNKTLYVPGPRRKEQWPHKILTQTCLWVSRSLQ